MTCPACGEDLGPTPVACRACGPVPPTPAPAGFVSPGEYLARTGREPVAQYAPVQYAPVPPASLTPPPAWTPPPPPPPPPPPRKGRVLPVIVLALALVITGGGVAAAGYHFGWFGDRTSPSMVVPASAVSYVQLDLDPSLVQKASAWQFLRELPQVRDAAASGQPDPKAIGWSLLADLPGNPLKGIDYERDVKPWIGHRIAAALVPRSGDQPAPLLAVQVTDEAKAGEALRDWSNRAEEEYDVTLRAGYALLTSRDDTGFLLGELAAGPLSANPSFAADFPPAADAGILAGWLDLGAAAKLGASPTAPDAVKGRCVFSLAFTADSMVLSGTVTGMEDGGVTGVVDLGELPGSTGGGLGFAGGGAAVQRLLPELGPQAIETLQQAGLDEGDLVALLGRSVSVGVAGFAAAEEPGGFPDVGVRIESDDPERARAALDKLFGDENGMFPINATVEGDVLLVSTSGVYLEQLAHPVSRLSAQERFTRSVPDHATASVAAWLDLAPPLAHQAGASAEYRDFLGALQGLGATYVADGAGSGSWSVRLVRS